MPDNQGLEELFQLAQELAAGGTEEEQAAARDRIESERAKLAAQAELREARQAERDNPSEETAARAREVAQRFAELRTASKQQRVAAQEGPNGADATVSPDGTQANAQPGQPGA